MRSTSFALAIILISGFSLQNAAAQSLMAYIEAPGDESSQATIGQSGAVTENFNSATPGTYSTPYASAIGTFNFSPTSKGVIQAADQFGGANNTQYMAFGSQSNTSGAVTINLNGSYNYLGFWLSAADANNGVTFYSNGTAFARFSTSNIVSLLSGSTVTALNGTTYNSSSYFGNPTAGPNKGADGSEPFVYVEFFSATAFNEVVLDNSGTTGTGFESDNYTVDAGSLSAPGTDVPVGSFAPVPEPSHYAVLFGMCILMLVYGRRWVGAYALRRDGIDSGLAA